MWRQRDAGGRGRNRSKINCVCPIFSISLLYSKTNSVTALFHATAETMEKSRKESHFETPKDKPAIFLQIFISFWRFDFMLKPASALE